VQIFLIVRLILLLRMVMVLHFWFLIMQTLLVVRGVMFCQHGSADLSEAALEQACIDIQLYVMIVD